MYKQYKNKNWNPYRSKIQYSEWEGYAVARNQIELKRVLSEIDFQRHDVKIVNQAQYSVDAGGYISAYQVSVKKVKMRSYNKQPKDRKPWY